MNHLVARAVVIAGGPYSSQYHWRNVLLLLLPKPTPAPRDQLLMHRSRNIDTKSLMENWIATKSNYYCRTSTSDGPKTQETQETSSLDDKSPVLLMPRLLPPTGIRA